MYHGVFEMMGKDRFSSILNGAVNPEDELAGRPASHTFKSELICIIDSRTVAYW